MYKQPGQGVHGEFGGNKLSKTIPPDKADITWRTHRRKSSHTRESGADQRRQPPQRMEQRASRTRERHSNTRLDPSAFRTEKHKDTSEKKVKDQTAGPAKATAAD